MKADHERSIEDLRMLTEIEAPPFKEQKRAEAFLARMKALGLADAKIDAEGNVVGLRKGTRRRARSCWSRRTWTPCFRPAPTSR